MAKKVFERDVDESVLSLSHDEKDELRKKLEQAKNEMQPENIGFEPPEEEPNKERKKTVVNPVSQERPVSFFRVLWNFLLSILFGIPFRKNANISIGRLREIKRHLNQLGIIFYNFKSSGVTSEFAFYILDIYKAARLCHDVFLNPKSVKNNDFFLTFFFEKILGPKLLAVQNELSPENIEKIFYDQQIANKREHVKLKQKMFSDALKSELTRIQTALLGIEQLINVFLHFDFKEFFSIFGALNENQVDIQLHEVEGEKLLPSLRNLGAVAKMVTEQEISVEAKEAFDYANQKMKEKKLIEPDQKYMVYEPINQALLMLRKLVKFDIIDSMIQYISMDDTQISGFAKQKKYLVQRYLNMVILETTKIFNQLEDEKAKEFLMKSILDFFQVSSEKELIYVGIYTPDTRHYLKTKADLEALNHLRSLSIVLTFLKKIYNGFLREVINTIVVKGSFIKKLQGEEFSATYYRLDDIIETLQNFLKTELTSSDTTKNPVVDVILSQKDITPVERRMIKEKFAKIDSYIAEAIEKICEEFYKIFVFLEKIRLDYKKTYPEVLANIRSLPHLSQSSFYAGLERAIQTLDQFFNIMRNFIVIKGEISDFLIQMENKEK